VGIHLRILTDRRFVKELSLSGLIVLSDHRVGLSCKALCSCKYPLSGVTDWSIGSGCDALWRIHFLRLFNSGMAEAAHEGRGLVGTPTLRFLLASVVRIAYR
jgi:hypothetical protein